jgi:hypothetical protein
MAGTYFYETKRDDGSPITVKYSFRNIGGSGCEVDIVDAWSDFDGSGIHASELTADECDRIVAQIAEHHED